MSRKRRTFWLLVAGIALLLAICTVLGSLLLQYYLTALPFETVDRSESGQLADYYPSQHPALFVITEREAVSGLDAWIVERAKEELRALDYDRFFALVVFHGTRREGGYEISVKGINRTGNVVIVRARRGGVRPGQARPAIVTSPYHVVRLAKMGVWGQNIRFVMIVWPFSVTSLSHFVP